MKGRYLGVADYQPQYYPVFWGLITEVNETYSNGQFNFTLTCQDLLVWWKYQKIALRPGAFNANYGSPSLEKIPTIFENMTAWEIIFSLFTDSRFIQPEDKEGNKGGKGVAYPQNTMKKSRKIIKIQTKSRISRMIM
jgi:hypothetical protein